MHTRLDTLMLGRADDLQVACVGTVPLELSLAFPFKALGRAARAGQTRASSCLNRGSCPNSIPTSLLHWNQSTHIQIFNPTPALHTYHIHP